MKLGVCYYPEHWPQAWWEEDARAMAALGILRVRIGEFAWSRIEPEPGQFAWEWLDLAIETLHRHGREIVLCTPTATPPKWLVDRTPEMLALSANGRERRFGSRRHYCFSSETYRAECVRITTALGERYGAHPGVRAWQTDNEYGCHDTTLSYSPMAARRFRRWLEARYGEVGALNAAWGNVFWSQEYRQFDEIDPPNLTVTEANPAHRLDYQRFASDEVVSFNRLQSDILRRLSPGRDILHNFMGFTTDFDHFQVARDLDAATWDSYPLGFLEQFWFSAEEKTRYRRQGHPDVSAFHHDLYRGVGRGRFQVMEQQPGPVNWAAYNPAPLPGMVRLWTWEAFAHGAETVSYFRWRQAPFGQEQYHAGLHRPDRSEDAAVGEIRETYAEMTAVGALAQSARADVALLFSYPADWLFTIQPQGADFRWLRLAFSFYSGLRRLGLDVDIVDPEADLSGYRLVVAPSLPMVPEGLADRLARGGAAMLFGPRSGAKTLNAAIPDGLPPAAALRQLLAMRVLRVESVRPGVDIGVRAQGLRLVGCSWRETIETEAEVLATFESDGAPAWIAAGKAQYLATWPEKGLLDLVLADVARKAGLAVQPMPDGVRVRRRGGLVFAFNHMTDPRVTPAPEGATFVLGGGELPAGGLAAWRENSQ